MPNVADSIPLTEQENPRTAQISSLPTEAILRLMNEEDARVAKAIAHVLPEISWAVEASEDDTGAGAHDLDARGFTKQDALVGIAASGRTPYTVGAVAHARRLGALTIAITCAPDSPITAAAEISIVPVVGPEVITGSTRLKAGTAQKMVLNMISTATMIRLGYVTGNRMTNVQTRNVKLRARALRILQSEAGLDEEGAKNALAEARDELPVALVMSKTGRSREEAASALKKSHGVIVEALELFREPR